VSCFLLEQFHTMDHRRTENIRYHGRGRGKWRRGGGSRRPAILPISAPPLGKILATIQHDHLEDSANQGDYTAQITNSQYLTSYNWLNGPNHQILVPGEKTVYYRSLLLNTNLIHFYKVNRRHGPLSLSLLNFEKTLANITVTQTPRDIPPTHWSR
jgi:hypothetical protein